MIAVIGCLKGVVRLRMKAPEAEPQEQENPYDYRQDPYAWQAAEEARMQKSREREESVTEKESGRSDENISVCGSGCAFNIAMNLAKKGCDVSFVSAVGNDFVGTALRQELQSAGVDTCGISSHDGVTAIDMEILNVLGDPEFLGRNDQVFDEITPELLEDRADILDNAEIIVMDGNLSAEAIGYVADKYGNKSVKDDGTERETKLFFDPATINGAAKVAGALDKFHCVMPGRMEAEKITGSTILSEEQLSVAGAFFSERGVDKSIITIKGGGLYYKEGEDEGVIRPERVLSFADTAGAGDVVSAAVVCGTLAGKSVAEIAAEAMDDAAAYLADRKDDNFLS